MSDVINEENGSNFMRAGRKALDLYLKPVKFSSKNNSKVDKKGRIHTFLRTCFGMFILWESQTWNAVVFPKIPTHYPLNRKFLILKNNTTFGRLWDVLMILLSLLACGAYVAETYSRDYHNVAIYAYIELVITQFFTLDFIYSALCSLSFLSFLSNSATLIDLLTIVPVYVSLMVNNNGQGPNFSVLRFVRILRLVRILRTFKLLRGLSGIKRQLITLTLTLLSLIFMASGLIQMMENDVKQALQYDCKYVNELTNYEPSCTSGAPADDSCDCLSNNCESYYRQGDSYGAPSGLKCVTLTFFDAFYYMIVTVATVGYGDIHPTTVPSKALVIIFIVTSLVVIPMQVNQLTVLISSTSQFRHPYAPSAIDNHVILCGHVNDWRKTEKFLKEFFHTDRNNGGANDFHLLILSPVEPNDDMRTLFLSPLFDSRVSYLIGTALSVTDLQKARADIASAIFILTNTEVNSESSVSDDTANVLRTLSVIDYNPNTECYIQMIRQEDRDILKDSKCDVIMCLDEYKTIIQARNAVCPGISTFIENLLHSFESTTTQKTERKFNIWSDEYVHGADMEIYYIQFSSIFLETLGHDWMLICEGLYLEYEVILLGACSHTNKSLVINPSKIEMLKATKTGRYAPRFFALHDVGVIIASDESIAQNITAGLKDVNVIERIIQKLIRAEVDFGVRKNKMAANTQSSPSVDRRGSQASPTPSIMRRFSNVERKQSTVTPIRGSVSNFAPVKAPTMNNEVTLLQLRQIGKYRQEKNILATADGDSSDEDDHNDTYLGYVKETAKPKNLIRQTFKKLTTLGHNLLSASDTHAASNSKYSPQVVSISEDEEDESKAPSWTGRGSAPAMRKLDSWSETSSPNLDRSYNVDDFDNVVGKSTKRQREITKFDIQFERDLQLLNTNHDYGDSKELKDASNFKSHIILFGCTTNLIPFIEELRRPLMIGFAYHPVIVIGEELPDKWNKVVSKYKDVYFMRGRLTSGKDFNRSNLRYAHAVVLLANKDSATKIEEEYLDADTLFAYLKLEKHIPNHVFFTIELTCASNMTVLNSTVNSSDLNDNSKNLKGAFVSHNLSKKQENNIFDNKKDDKRGSILSSPSGKSVDFGRRQTNQANDLASLILSMKKRARKNRKNLKDPELFWSAFGTYHLFPVFAAGRAFYPSSFDNILCHCFYNYFTPLLYEKLVCGQKYQTIYRIRIPESFAGRWFVDIYRAFVSHFILPLGLYRCPNAAQQSILPFVYTCPRPETLLRLDDHIYVYCNPIILQEVLEKIKKPLVYYPDNSVAIDGLEITENIRQQHTGSSPTRTTFDIESTGTTKTSLKPSSSLK